MKPDDRIGGPQEDETLESIRKFNLGNAITDPRYPGPAINSELFAMLRGLFRKKPKKAKRKIDLMSSVDNQRRRFPSMKASQTANTSDKKLRAVSDDTYDKDKDTEDARMAVARQFYMVAPNTSPHSQGPSISSEAFLFLKNLFRRRPRGKSHF